MSKRKLVVFIAGSLLAGGVFCPAVLLAEGLQPETKMGLDTGPKDVNFSNQPGQAAVSRAEGEIFYKMLLSVVVVIVLGVAVVYVSKKVLPRFTHISGKQIRVIETTHIAPRKGLHLVEVGSRRLLIASTNEQITMLAEVTEPTGDFASELEARCKDK